MRGSMPATRVVCVRATQKRNQLLGNVHTGNHEAKLNLAQKNTKKRNAV
jgi:1,2-phenylacetyl-CoA epoxidase PaaB subunit